MDYFKGIILIPHSQLLDWKENKCRNISGSGGQLIKLDGVIYYGGSSGRLYEYIELEQKWKSMPSVGVWEFGLGVCNGKLFIIGGRNLSFNATKDILYFEQAGRKWRQGTPMKEECENPSVLSISSGLVVMGVMPNANNRVQVFRGSDEQWYFGGKLPIGCREISSTCYTCDVVFINKAHTKSVWYADIKDLVSNIVFGTCTYKLLPIYYFWITLYA